MRLLCLPYAGSDAVAVFSRWYAHCPRDLEIIPIILPGRGTRIKEKPFDNIVDMVETMGQALIPFIYGPYAIFGHSMGALIAFELGRWLETRQRGSMGVFVSGCAAPNHPRTHAKHYALPDDEFIGKLRLLKGTPPEVLAHTELIQVLLPTLRADFKACNTYMGKLDAPLNAPIVAFNGLGDDITRPQLEDWARYTSGPFSVHTFEGDHFFLRDHYPEMIRIIGDQFRRTRI
jgi:surfactin synthase thioesterase subunit